MKASNRIGFGLAVAVAVAGGATAASAQPVVLERDGSTIVLEAYAPNVVRVTLSLERRDALTPPGFGFVAPPDGGGWTHAATPDVDVYRSPRLVVTVAANEPGTPLDTQKDIARFFNGSAPPADITFATPEGKTLLVAPVTEQGVTRRSVYLPAGTDWFDYWTNERLPGGRTVEVAAAIDTLPLFVRAGSIVPYGAPVLHTKQKQDIAAIRVWPGADASFTLYDDDGRTYAYEKDGGRVTRLSWDDRAGKLTSEGPAAWAGSVDGLLKIVGR